MASKVGIINSALVLIGDKPLNSLTEDRRAAVVANQIYADVFEAELSKHRWGFARTVQQLNQLTSEPPIDNYRFAYQLPADLIIEVRVWPNHHDYKKYGTQMWTNQHEVQLDYIRKVTEAELPNYFVRLLTYALARDFATSIRDEVDRFQAMDIRYKEEGRNARFQDSQAYPQDPIQDAPLIDQRF